jgi:hypothetical protein
MIPKQIKIAPYFCKTSTIKTGVSYSVVGQTALHLRWQSTGPWSNTIPFKKVTWSKSRYSTNGTTTVIICNSCMSKPYRSQYHNSFGDWQKTRPPNNWTFSPSSSCVSGSTSPELSQTHSICTPTTKTLSISDPGICLLQDGNLMPLWLTFGFSSITWPKTWPLIQTISPLKNGSPLSAIRQSSLKKMVWMWISLNCSTSVPNFYLV